MSLKEQIDHDIKEAMKAKQKDELKALRSIKSLILLAESEKGASGEISADAEMKLLMKAAKQRKESAETYATNNRQELADAEMAELEIIERYLPKQLSEEDLTTELKKIIEEVGATEPKDMGKVMGVATKKLAGRADGKAISEITKKILNA